jgi:hypothetical protein
MLDTLLVYKFPNAMFIQLPITHNQLLVNTNSSDYLEQAETSCQKTFTQVLLFVIGS